MSLLDSFLRDALLQTVVQSDVYVAIRTDASPSATQPIGAGTATDPYGGTSTNPAWFDYMMTNLVQQNQTIRLGPGTFYTTGHSGDGTYAGWVPKNGCRVVGSRVGSTTLKISSVPSGGVRFAVGLNFSNATVSAFELSGMTIDASFPASPGAQTRAGAIRLRGSGIYIHRVKVINWGNKGGPEASVITAAGDGSENCVIANSVVEAPAAGHDYLTRMFALDATTAPHYFCVVRNCAGRGNTTFEPAPAISSNAITGIYAGWGVGAIIEGNQLANVGYGIWNFGPTSDLVIWNNYIRNAWQGVLLENSSATTPVARVIVSDNCIEMATASGSFSPTGILFTTTQSAQRFDTVIARKNIIRAVILPVGGGIDPVGMQFARCGNLIAENNVVNDTADSKAVRFSNCGTTKFFNNQNTAGLLLRGYDTIASKSVLELDDSVQDVLLAM